MNDWASPDISELCAALSAAQGAMTGVKKGETANLGTFSYKYASLADCREAIKKPLADNGLGFMQMPFSGETGCLSLRSVLTHKSGQWVKTEYILPHVEEARMNPHQSESSAVTYACRTTLCAMLGIALDDDDGAAASSPGSSATPPAPPGTVPFGKHRGKQWSEVADEYLEWASKTDNPAMRDAAKAELSRRIDSTPETKP